MLRRYLEARRAGDDAAARQWWGQMLTANFDRLRTMVYLESNGRLSPEEQEDAIQRAAIVMATRRAGDFRGSTLGEWVNMLKRVVHGACTDVQRRETRHSKRKARLETTGPDGGLLTSTEADEALARRAEELAEDLRSQEELLAHGREFLEWALPQLTADQRAMIECDLEGLPVEKIMRRLKRKRDAVYQLRRRSLNRLIELREEYEA